jgi:hypothetical protein
VDHISTGRTDSTMGVHSAANVSAGNEMKFITDRPYADPEAAARKLIEIANSVEALIRDLDTDSAKREMFNRLYDHFNRLADEIEGPNQPRGAAPLCSLLNRQQYQPLVRCGHC